MYEGLTSLCCQTRESAMLSTVVEYPYALRPVGSHVYGCYDLLNETLSVEFISCAGNAVGAGVQEPAIPGRPVAVNVSPSPPQICSASTSSISAAEVLRCSSPVNTEEVDNGGKCTARLSQLFNNSKFSDITLVVGHRRFYAHKLLLANASDVFE